MPGASLNDQSGRYALGYHGGLDLVIALESCMSSPPPSAEPSGYVPGVCNIGPAERRQRRQFGFLSAFAAVVLAMILIATHASRPWRLLLFIPVAGAASGFLQDRMHFCAGFGMRGVANVFNDVGDTEDVLSAEFRKQDQQKAIQIMGLSVAAGTVVTVLALLV